MQVKCSVLVCMCLFFASCSAENLRTGLSNNIVQQSPTNLSMVNTNDWNVCKNVAGGYTFKYPSGWKIFENAPGAFEEISCQVAPADITLAADINKLATNHIEFSLTATAELVPRPTSLDEYISANPETFPQNQRRPGIEIDGEPTTWVEGDTGNIAVFSWHKSVILQVNVFNTPVDEVNMILGSFRFVN